MDCYRLPAARRQALPAPGTGRLSWTISVQSWARLAPGGFAPSTPCPLFCARGMVVVPSSPRAARSFRATAARCAGAGLTPVNGRRSTAATLEMPRFVMAGCGLSSRPWSSGWKSRGQATTSISEASATLPPTAGARRALSRTTFSSATPARTSLILKAAGGGGPTAARLPREPIPLTERGGLPSPAGSLS